MGSSTGREESASVGMKRRRQQGVIARELDDLASMHHGDTAAQVADHGEIVRNEDQRQREALLYVVEQIENLGLNRDVECGHRFVQDEKLGLEGQSASNPEPLPLATAERVWVALGHLPGKAYDVEQLADLSRRARRAKPGTRVEARRRWPPPAFSG